MSNRLPEIAPGVFLKGDRNDGDDFYAPAQLVTH